MSLNKVSFCRCVGRVGAFFLKLFRSKLDLQRFFFKIGGPGGGCAAIPTLENEKMPCLSIADRHG